MNVPIIIASTITPKNFVIPDEFPIITSDNFSIAEMATKHLISRGFRHFGFCGYPHISWSHTRADMFIQTLNAKGYTVHSFKQENADSKNLWAYEETDLIRWLQSLPKPIGIMTCCDDRSRDLIEAARVAEIRIPEDIGILGVDNDKLVCDLSNPTLSSISLDTESAGYRAAELLDKLMSGEETMNGQKIIINPICVQARRSTGVLAIEDEMVREAMRYIRENIRKPITVDDVAQNTCLSRRSLERRFLKETQRSLYEDICQVREEYISKMLLETNMTQLQIAHAAGFYNIDNLRRFFYRQKKMTPLQFRAQKHRSTKPYELV